MTGRVCPFCGLAADVPHESQEGCIAALHGEIARMRNVLDHSNSGGPGAPDPAEGQEPA